MKKLRFAGLMAGLVLASLPSGAQFVSPYVGVQGSLSSSSGIPAANATLTFSPSQVFFVGGTSVVVSEGQCGTDTNGSVVGIGNPLVAPRVTPQFTGTLTPGNYYVQFTWYDQFGKQTLPSPEVAVQLTNTGELNVLPPVGTGPPQATGMQVYIGSTSGSETLQGQTTSTTAQFTQAVPLVAGAGVPNLNLTACRVVANDAGFPTGTGYNVSLLDASGNTLFSYPEMWQFFGPGSTYNLSQGIPYYHGQVTYPIPVLTIPLNHNPQSISGPLSLTGYNLYNVGAIGVGTGLPAWGVDVEGTGLNSIVNAAGGYLVNGTTGSTGDCLGSDGTAYNTPIACSSSFYQTIQFNGVPVAQEPILNFLGPLTVAAVGGKTNVGVSTTGSETQLVTASGASASGLIAVWDAFGGLTGTSTIPGQPVTQTNATSGRTANAAFHNTSTLPLYIQGFFLTPGGSSTGSVSCLDGPSSPSLTVWAQENAATVAGQAAGFTCLIPPGYFYEIMVGGDVSATPTSWFETSF
jgi:hypothetical protein